MSADLPSSTVEQSSPATAPLSGSGILLRIFLVLLGIFLGIIGAIILGFATGLLDISC